MRLRNGNKTFAKRFPSRFDVSYITLSSTWLARIRMIVTRFLLFTKKRVNLLLTLDSRIYSYKNTRAQINVLWVVLFTKHKVTKDKTLSLPLHARKTIDYQKIYPRQSRSTFSRDIVYQKRSTRVKLFQLQDEYFYAHISIYVF